MQHEKTSIMASGPMILVWQIEGEKVEAVIFLVSQINADGDSSYEIKSCSLEGNL